MGGHRIILNLRHLNESIQYHLFKIEMLDSAVKLLTKDCFMASSDFKYTHYSVPIHDAYQRYLKFKFDDGLFCFTAFATDLHLVVACSRNLWSLCWQTWERGEYWSQASLMMRFWLWKLYEQCHWCQYHWQTQWGLLCPTNPVLLNQLKRLRTWVLSQIRGRWLKLTPERAKKDQTRMQ